MLPILFHFPDWVPLLGGEAVTSFGVMMFLAFVTAGVILRKEMERNGYDGEKAWDLVFMAVIGGIVGAKLYYVFLNFDRFQAEGLAFLFSRGGMVWYGGLLGATILVLWQAKKLGLPLLKIMDFSAPALALAYAVGRVGCFLVGDDWGRPTDSWVGIRFPEGFPPTRVDIIERQFGIAVDPALVQKYGEIVPVHPTQLYEVAMSTLIFLFLWRIRGKDAAPGWLFTVWLALAGAERFIVEIFRAKDDRFFGALTLAQVISLGLIAFALVWMSRLRKTAPGSAV
ncbi:MAG TPA: prolipoprotein diacylglyceryl transferase [Longimicrobiales bacterium]|nr:prolipoprotein diacylglyceryl transferase [Longimicrobiales bacterium]